MKTINNCMKHRKSISEFVANLAKENYAAARDNLRDVVVEKMKDRIRDIEKEHKENRK